MPHMVLLKEGDNDLADPAIHWKVKIVDSIPPSLQLIASIQSDPRQTTAPTRGETATTLAIQMGVPAATALYKLLHERMGHMGWRPVAKDESQA
jgi:hypothetical protein